MFSYNNYKTSHSNVKKKVNYTVQRTFNIDKEAFVGTRQC